MRLLHVLTLVVAAVVATLAPAAEVAPLPPLDRAAQEAIAKYMNDPAANRARLLSLGAHGAAGLPNPIVLLLADAEARRGRWASANRLFAEVLARQPDPTWAGLAEQGLGWGALATGDFEAAYAHYQRAAATDQSPLPKVVLALIEAADGLPGAAATLGRLAEDPRASPPLREVSRLGAGYAYLWAGDPSNAKQAFHAVPDGPLDDDARYGAARASWEMGDRDGARTALRELAASEGSGTNPRRINLALVRLEPVAVFRAGLERHRRLPVAGADEQLMAMLDADGAALARAALRARPRAADAAESPLTDAAGRTPGGAKPRLLARHRRANDAGASPAASPGRHVVGGKDPAPGPEGSARPTAGSSTEPAASPGRWSIDAGRVVVAGGAGGRWMLGSAVLAALAALLWWRRAARGRRGAGRGYPLRAAARVHQR